MRKSLMLVVALSLMAGGCAWFTSSEESETVTPAAQAEEPATPAAEPAPAAAPAKKAAPADPNAVRELFVEFKG